MSYCRLTKGISPKMCILWVRVLLNLFVFGSCFRTLAVILFQIFVNSFLPSNAWGGLVHEVLLVCWTSSLSVGRLGRKLTVQSFYALAGVGCVASAICRIFTGKLLAQLLQCLVNCSDVLSWHTVLRLHQVLCCHSVWSFLF